MLLILLRSADDHTLCESGNPVYIKLKEELDRVQANIA